MTDEQDYVGGDCSAVRRQRLLEKMRVLTASLKETEENGTGEPSFSDLDKTFPLDDSFDTIASREIWTSAPSFPPQVAVAPSVSSAFGSSNNQVGASQPFLSFDDMVSSSYIDHQQVDASAEANNLSKDTKSRSAWRKKMQMLADYDEITDAGPSPANTSVSSVTKANNGDGCLATRMSLVMPSSCYSSTDVGGPPDTTGEESLALRKITPRIPACIPFRKEQRVTEEAPVGALSREDASQLDQSSQLDLMVPPSLTEKKRISFLKPCVSGAKGVPSADSTFLSDDYSSIKEMETDATANTNSQLFAACSPLRVVKSKELTTYAAAVEPSTTLEKRAGPKSPSRRRLLGKMHVLTYCNPLREHQTDGEINDDLKKDAELTPYREMFPDIDEEIVRSKTLGQNVDTPNNKLSQASTAAEWNPVNLDVFDTKIEAKNEYSDSLFRGFDDSGHVFSSFVEKSPDGTAPRTPPRRTPKSKKAQQDSGFRVTINVVSQDNDVLSAGKSSASTSPGNTASVSTTDQSGFPIEPIGARVVESPRRAPTPGKQMPADHPSQNGDDPGIDAFFQPFMDFLLGPAEDDLHDSVHSLDDADDSSEETSYGEYSRDEDSSMDDGSDADSVAVQAKVKLPKSSANQLREASDTTKAPVPHAISALDVDRPMSPMGAEENQFEKLPCACGNQEACNGISAGFFMLHDDRAGYIQVPEYRKDTETHFGLETNRLRYALLRPFSTGEEQDELAQSGESLYVANHHFHPKIIISQSKGSQPGILPMYISENAMVGLGLDLLQHNQVLNDFGVPTGYYYVVPNYKFEQSKEDLKQAIKNRREKLEKSMSRRERPLSPSIADALKTKESELEWYDRID